jgi:hypothetical protein
MALVVSKKNIGAEDGSAVLFTYDNLDELDLAPAGFEAPEYANKSVQVVGTFGTATIIIQGSNDGTNWVTLSDPQGTAISKTAAFIEQILENTRFVRPLVSTGAGADLDVFFVAQRSSSLRS